MFSGKISEIMANQIEKKVSEGGLSNLTDSELSQLAIEFVGDAPPSHVPRETVIEILSQQQDITNWREQIKQKAIDAAKNKVSEVASNVDPKMMEMIKTQFGEWLKNSGYNTAELTAKLDKNLDGIISRDELNSFIRELSGSEPPAWVSDTVVAIIDNDGDGKIRIDELWAYLGTIGFEVPIAQAEEEAHLDEELEKMVEGNEIQRAPSITISEILDFIGEKVTYLKCDSEGGELALIDDRIGEIDYLGIEIHSWILSTQKQKELESHLSQWFNIKKVSQKMWECKNKRL